MLLEHVLIVLLILRVNLVLFVLLVLLILLLLIPQSLRRAASFSKHFLP